MYETNNTPLPSPPHPTPSLFLSIRLLFFSYLVVFKSRDRIVRVLTILEMGPKKQKKKRKQLVSEYNACSVNGLKQGINNIVLVLKMRNNFSYINDNDVRISTVAYS